MNENRETARGLLRKATDDCHAVARLSETPAASIWIIGFHAQQAVEKALKAVLAFQGVHYPFTHDLASLIALLHKKELPLPPETECLPHLTPFGTQFRYEDEDLEPPTSIDSDIMLKWVRTTLDWARGCLDDSQ